MVDEADPFPAVLERVVAWLQERELGTKYKYAILTDGYAPTCCCLHVLLLEKSQFERFCFQVLGHEQVPQHPVSAQPHQIPSVCKEVDKYQEILQELLQGLDSNTVCVGDLFSDAFPSLIYSNSPRSKYECVGV